MRLQQCVQVLEAEVRYHRERADAERACRLEDEADSREAYKGVQAKLEEAEK